MESNEENSAVDRISDLPDLILTIILSHLPTKTAVSTSILSTKWKTLDPFHIRPITLDFDDSFILSTTLKPIPLSRTFIHFVDKLLGTILSRVSCVETIKFKCKNYYGAYKILSWVHAALRLNVQDLTLQVSMMTSTVNKLFNRLNRCKTLTRLELRERFKVSVPINFSLPSLKVLVLFKLRFAYLEEHSSDPFMFERLFDGCPVLEELYFSHCILHSGHISIESSVLKKLTIKDNWRDESMCGFTLDVPMLEVLVYDDWIPMDCYFSDIKSLVTAHINVGYPVHETSGLAEALGDYDQDDPWFSFDVSRLAIACSSTVSLYLSTCSIYALQRLPMLLPIFENLTSLALGCILGSKGWAILARLLCNAPNLDKLALDEGFGEHRGGYSCFESRVKSPPICLQWHLKEIKFMVFNEKEDEFKLIEYFLKNGKFIQKLELHCMPCKDETTLIRLHMLSTHSKIDFQLR